MATVIMDRFNKKLAQRMKGKTLAEMYFTIGADTTELIELKKVALDDFNAQLGTNYKITSINEWLAGTRSVPKRVRPIMTKEILEYVFGLDVAECLQGIYSNDN